MDNSLEESLNKLHTEIDEIELNIKVCDNHIQFLHDMKNKRMNNFYSVTECDSLIAQDTMKRIKLQEKIRELMYKRKLIEQEIFNE